MIKQNGDVVYDAKTKKQTLLPLREEHFFCLAMRPMLRSSDDHV